MEDKNALKSIIARVEKLEKAVFGSDRRKTLNYSQKEKEFKGATGGLRLLISKNFFSKKRTFGEIKKELGSLGYHYSNQAIQTPLITFSRPGGPLVAFKEKGRKVYAKRK